MKTSEFTRSIWLWIFNSGGYYTAAEIARATNTEMNKLLDCLAGMSRRKLIVKRRAEASHRLVYGIDGTCLVPCGLALAEVQG